MPYGSIACSFVIAAAPAPRSPSRRRCARRRPSRRRRRGRRGTRSSPAGALTRFVQLAAIACPELTRVHHRRRPPPPRRRLRAARRLRRASRGTPLPVGSVTPTGWLLEQLTLQAEGRSPRRTAGPTSSRACGSAATPTAASTSARRTGSTASCRSRTCCATPGARSSRPSSASGRRRRPPAGSRPIGRTARPSTTTRMPTATAAGRPRPPARRPPRADGGVRRARRPSRRRCATSTCSRRWRRTSPTSWRTRRPTAGSARRRAATARAFWGRSNIMLALAMYAEANAADPAVAESTGAMRGYALSLGVRLKATPLTSWAAQRWQDIARGVQWLLDHAAGGHEAERLPRVGDVLHSQGAATGRSGSSWATSRRAPFGESLYNPPYVHNVNAAQGLKSAAVWWRQSRNASLRTLSRTRVDKLDAHCGLPTGMYVGDELIDRRRFHARRREASSSAASSRRCSWSKRCSRHLVRLRPPSAPRTAPDERRRAVVAPPHSTSRRMSRVRANTCRSSRRRAAPRGRPDRSPHSTTCSTWRSGVVIGIASGIAARPIETPRRAREWRTLRRPAWPSSRSWPSPSSPPGRKSLDGSSRGSGGPVEASDGGTGGCDGTAPKFPRSMAIAMTPSGQVSTVSHFYPRLDQASTASAMPTATQSATSLRCATWSPTYSAHPIQSLTLDASPRPGVLAFHVARHRDESVVLMASTAATSMSSSVRPVLGTHADGDGCLHRRRLLEFGCLSSTGRRAVS